MRLVLLVVVTAKISLPVGGVCSPPAPELRAWEKQAKALKKHGVPTQPRPPTPARKPQYPPTHQRALRFLEACTAPHPASRMHCLSADALSGTAPCVADASAMCGGVQVLSHLRRTPHLRGGQRAQHVATSCATHPGTLHPIRIRGGDEGVGWISRARFSGCAHNTTRCMVAIT